MTTASVPASKTNQVATGLGWGVFLCGFVPGLLQYRAGRPVRAAVAFLTCAALFFVGWPLVADRLFYFALLSPEDAGERAGAMGWIVPLLARLGLPLTLPEILNLPANAVGAFLSYDVSNDGMRMWRVPRDAENLGGFLTAASGMLAAFWSADGHWLLRWRRDAIADRTPAPRCSPGLAAGVSWLLPGLGHVLAGQRGKGALVGGATLAMFALGMVFGELHSVDRAIAPVWWIGQSLCGGGALVAALFTAPIPMGPEFPAQLELGTILCTVAGFMNLVVMVDAYSVAERHSFPLRTAEVIR